MIEKPTTALIENIITLLCYNDEYGKVITNMVDHQLFEGDYRVVAERAIGYWQQYGEAPGIHTSDLVSDIIDDPHNRKAGTFKRILIAMQALSDSVNTTYVMEQLRSFTRMQKLKEAILKSAEQLNSQQETAISSVEEIWNNLLRSQETTFDPGTRLTEYGKVLAYMDTQAGEFTTGIPTLDRNGIVPMRGTLGIFLAPTGFGKSWYLIHLGKQALAQRKNILHVSLEMSEEEVLQRYYQSLYSIPKRHTPDLTVTTLDLDERGKLIDLGTEEIIPDFTFASKNIEIELNTRLMNGARNQNLIVKRFPPRSITVKALEAFIDNLEATEKFIPDLLILDYIGIMKTNADNHRITLGRCVEDLRGLGISRNIAIETAHQINRTGATSTHVQSTHVGEDWSMIGTADKVITYSRTKEEKKRGLARLFVNKSRSEEDHFGLIITQNYKVGQFHLESVLLPSDYWDKLKETSEDLETEES